MNYKSEIQFLDGRVFLAIESTITSEEEQRLLNDGWKLLNNGTTLDSEPSVPAFLYWKQL